MQKVNSSDKNSIHTLLSMNIVIDDRLTCNVNKVFMYIYDFADEYLCIINYLGSFYLIISKTNHISSILKGIS